MLAVIRRVLRRLTGSRAPTEAERLKLESWVRLRFRLASTDPTSHVIAAASRLTEAGLDTDEAVDTVLRIADEVSREEQASRGRGRRGPAGGTTVRAPWTRRSPRVRSRRAWRRDVPVRTRTMARIELGVHDGHTPQRGVHDPRH